jgi:hypothetical protein
MLRNKLTKSVCTSIASIQFVDMSLSDRIAIDIKPDIKNEIAIALLRNQSGLPCQTDKVSCNSATGQGFLLWAIPCWMRPAAG